MKAQPDANPHDKSFQALHPLVEQRDTAVAMSQMSPVVRSGLRGMLRRHEILVARSAIPTEISKNP